MPPSSKPSGKVALATFRSARDPNPAAGHAAVKNRVNAVALAPADDFRRDADLFAEGVGHPEAQTRIRTAFQRGFQTRDAEIDLARVLV